MERIAHVYINLPVRSINKPFSYLIPEHFDFLQIGWRVLVPFGNRKLEGFVWDISDSDPAVTGKLKYIADVPDEHPWFDAGMLRTAQWLCNYYLCTPAEVLRLFIPGKTGIRSDSLYRLREDLTPEQTARLSFANTNEQQIFQYILQHRSVTLSVLKKQFGLNTAKLLRGLAKHSLVVSEGIAVKAARGKYQQVIRLAVAPTQAAARLNQLTKRPAQHRLLAALLTQTTLDTAELQKLKISRDTVQRLAADGLIQCDRVQVLRDSYCHIGIDGTTGRLQLTVEQNQVLSFVLAKITERVYASFLLYGITGSGKTQVYIEAAKKTRSMNRQAIILVPEIALTSQIVSRFKAEFADDVVVIHSKLSAGERWDAYQKLRQRQAGIVIGVRSAIFAPVPDLGLIILDEEHEFTYKQEESPRYHTRQVALIRAELSAAVVVFGSATPAIETYYQALQQRHQLLTMSSRIDKSALPAVTVVDMRQELAHGRRNVISLPLQQLLAETITRGEQAIILLNRRGYATFVMCRECGHVVKCDKCAVSLVYHNTTNLLRCHYCQTQQRPPEVCPVCGSHYIRYFGTGTQKLEEELARLLPATRIVRMDQDSTGGKFAHDRILTAFSQGEYDILLGTQMVAKGHDIKNVTAVGIIAADSALNLPDFRAAERTFSLITQAAGRAGRGDKAGQVVVQTYNPDHYAIQAGAKHDYTGFYDTEIVYRQELGYPPFGQIIKMTILAGTELQVRQQGEEIAVEVKRLCEGIAGLEIIGPFFAPIAKINNVCRLQLLLKAPELTIVKQRLYTSALMTRSDILMDVDPLSSM